jgi:glycosidase
MGIVPKPVIYQLVVRLFGNTNDRRKKDGTLEENGVGRFADINAEALRALREMGVTHVWLTGVLRHATLTDYSDWGMPADPPDIVKGRAGSFYAIRDCYDVSPDYATDPATRHAEFDALLARIRGAGLVSMIDLVPNHVARSYASVIRPEMDFGLRDDTSRFFDRHNNYFYLVAPPGQSLRLTPSPHWNPPGLTFGNGFAREDGSPGHPPRATGNNVTSPTPSATDWYETVKLNYGFNFVNGERRFSPVPDTWTQVDAILAYWQARGVGGFRCDFAHYIPSEAWRYLIERVKTRDPSALVIGEAYEELDALVDAGFDAVYAFETYNAAKLVYTGERALSEFDATLGLGETRCDRRVHYLENHDERRMPSPVVRGVGPGETGFGSTDAVRQLGPIFYLASTGPVIIFNGQEVGEEGSGDEGFGGDDGRTTIFDYGTMPALRRWVNGHAYDGGELDEKERALRAYYAELLALAQDTRIREGRHASLFSWNQRARFEDANDGLYTFARYLPNGRSVLLVVANFAVGGASSGRVRLPEALVSEAGLARSTVRVRVVLDDRGVRDDVLHGALDASSLVDAGLAMTVANQAATVVVVEAESAPP